MPDLVAYVLRRVAVLQLPYTVSLTLPWHRSISLAQEQLSFDEGCIDSILSLPNGGS